MRLENYLNESDFNLLGCFFLTDELNEVSDETFVKIQQLGHKMGIKVRKTKTFQNLISGAGKGLLRLMKVLIQYSLEADILDREERKQLEQNIKSEFAKVKKEDVIAFFVNLDKTFLGITAIPRHILQNILGVEFTSYNNWASNHAYVEQNMQKIIAVLMDMKDEENIALAKRIYKNVTGKDI